MKKIFLFSVASILFISASLNAQVKVNQGVSSNTISSSSAFLDASVTNVINSPNIGKGIIYPRANLTAMVLTNQGSLYNSSNNPNRFDGIIVYNTGTGATVSGQGISTAVTPGFYYFSNPTAAAPSATVGQWVALGGAATTVKTKTVTNVVVAANPTSATLDLGVGTITANEVVSFIGAKIYNSTGELVMDAAGAYNRATNVVTTSSGLMFHVLPAGTYSVIVSYR
jgi:hypothetical protein